MRVSFHEQLTVNMPQRKLLKKFITHIFKKEKTSFSSVDIIFCTDEYLLSINRQFLKHDYYTDIITFNLSKEKMPVEGEIYISVDRVRDNSKILASTFKEELKRVIFHGILHLCGYLDKTKAQEQAMRKKENSYLKLYDSFHESQFP